MTRVMPWAIALLLWSGQGIAGEDALHRGQQVFEKWCATCHSAGVGMPGTMALNEKYHGSVPGALEQRHDLTADQVTFYVRHGVSVMPPFRKTEISDAELSDLSAWLDPHGRATTLASASSAEQLLAHHVEAVKRGDVDAVLQDYRADAVIVVPAALNPDVASNPTGIFRGSAQIRRLFGFYAKGRHGDASARMETRVDPITPEVHLMHWFVYRGTPAQFSGEDIFVTQDGKIIFQDMQPPRGQLAERP